MQNEWELADRIADRIVARLNEERRKPGFSSAQGFWGQLLALI